MAQQLINVGASANDNTGDSLRDAFIKVNANVIDLQLSITTSSDSSFNNIKVGKGAGNIGANTAVGKDTLTSNTTGDSNSAFGNSALNKNNSGLGNSSFSFFSLYNNTNGNYNSSFGYQSLYNNISASNNSSFGYNSLFNNTIGAGNVAFGSRAMFSSIILNNNTAIGNDAMYGNTLYSNCTALGNSSSITADNQITLGNSSITSLRCNVQTITSLSDKRDKTDIIEISEGLDFISKLKPVTFTWNQRDGGRVGIKASGFIAQDLLELQNDSLIGENLDLVSDIDPDQLEARYANLMPVMIKAIQELKAEIELLKMK